MDRSTLARRGCALLTALLIGVLCAQALAADFQAGVHAYEQGDFAVALGEFRPLAEQGYFSAQFYLGLMYHLGMGVSRDDGEAVRWYRRAAGQGHAPALFSLGVMHDFGMGVPDGP